MIVILTKDVKGTGKAGESRKGKRTDMRETCSFQRVLQKKLQKEI